MQPVDRTLSRVARVTWILGAVGTLGALLLASGWTALSVAAGAALAALNFEALRRLGRRLLARDRGRGAVALVLVTKVAVLFAALYVLVGPVGLDGVALAGGTSALVVSILFEGLRNALAPSEAEGV